MYTCIWNLLFLLLAWTKLLAYKLGMYFSFTIQFWRNYKILGQSNRAIIESVDFIAKEHEMAVKIGYKFESEVFSPSMFWGLFYSVLICPCILRISDFDLQCKRLSKFSSSPAKQIVAVNRKIFRMYGIVTLWFPIPIFKTEELQICSHEASSLNYHHIFSITFHWFSYAFKFKFTLETITYM